MQYTYRCCLRARVSLFWVSKSHIIIGVVSRHSIDICLSPFLDHSCQSVRLKGMELRRLLRHRVLFRRIASLSIGHDVTMSAWCNIPDQTQRAVVIAHHHHATNILPATQTVSALVIYNTAAYELAFLCRHDRLPESPLTSVGRVFLGGEAKVPNTRGLSSMSHCFTVGFARLDFVCAIGDAVRSERKKIMTAI